MKQPPNKAVPPLTATAASVSFELRVRACRTPATAPHSSQRPPSTHMSRSCFGSWALHLQLQYKEMAPRRVETACRVFVTLSCAARPRWAWHTPAPAKSSMHSHVLCTHRNKGCGGTTHTLTARSRRPASTLRLWPTADQWAEQQQGQHMVVPCWPHIKRKCWWRRCPAAGNAQAGVARLAERGVALTQSTMTHTTEHTPISNTLPLAGAGCVWATGMFAVGQAAAPAGVNINKQEPCQQTGQSQEFKCRGVNRCGTANACMYISTRSATAGAHTDTTPSTHQQSGSATLCCKAGSTTHCTHVTAATRCGPPMSSSLCLRLCL